MPFSTGISWKQPNCTPNRSLMGGILGSRLPASRENQVAGELALGPPFFVDFGPVQNLVAFIGELVRKVGRHLRALEVFGVERLAFLDNVVEFLERDSQQPLPAVRGVGIGHLRGEFSAAPDDEDSPVLDCVFELEARAGNGFELYLLVYLPAEGAGLGGGQVSADAPVGDSSVVAHRGEIHPEGQVARIDPEADRVGFERPPARVILVRVVAQDGDDRYVRLGGDAGRDGVHEAALAPARKRVHLRRMRGLKRRQVSQRRDRPVPQAVEHDVQDFFHLVRSLEFPTSQSICCLTEGSTLCCEGFPSQ